MTPDERKREAQNKTVSNKYRKAIKPMQEQYKSINLNSKKKLKTHAGMTPDERKRESTNP